MKKERLEEIISSIDKETFETFYRKNSDARVTEYFNLSYTELKHVLLELGVQKKTKEETANIIRNTLLNKSEEEKKQATDKRLDTRSKWSNEYRKALAKKQAETRLNYTEEQKKHQLDAFHKTLASKSKEEIELKRKRNSEGTKKYFESLSCEQRTAFSNKMKAVYAAMPEDKKLERAKKIADSYKESCIKKYGVTNALNLPEVKEKIKKTVQEKYGVEYACQAPQCRLKGNNSSVNVNFSRLLTGAGISNFQTEFPIDNLSYDFKIGNVLVELNPTATHNSTWAPFSGTEKDKTYHYNKTRLAVDNGYRCINVWDWDDVDKIIKLLLPRPSVYARKCSIKLVDKKEAQDFINTYHLQGYAKDSIRLGLYHNDELISIMTFDRPRYNKNYEYELVRYCSSYNVIGGAKKLFKHFLTSYSPNSIISYCDLSKFTGTIYQKLGFTFKNYSIGKHWYNIKTGKHITDNLLRQRGFDQLLGEEYGYYGKGTSNEYLMLMNGFVEIFDAGQAVHIFTKQ